MNRTPIPIIAALTVALANCAPATSPQIAEPLAEPLMGDADLLKVGGALPGFGGMFFDDEMNLNVYLVEDVQQVTGRSLENRTTQVRAAIEAAFGSDVLAQGGRRPSDRADGDALQQAPSINLVQGEYDIRQLVDWRAEIDRLLDLPGVVSTDLDERRNRLAVGIESSAARANVEAALERLGVPRDAVLIEEVKPVRFHATLRSRFRSMPGGVQIEADTGVFAFSTCTMGFNAIRSGVSGFVTNSHCTRIQGGSEDTDFHQPDDPWWTEGNKVGDEIADPAYSVGGTCPSGRRCRFSDSAFVDYTVSRGLNIARTTAWNTGTLTINDPRPRLLITGETSTWIDGSELDKMGRTTGWTYGRVAGTCRNINVADSDVTLFCQSSVNRISGQTHTMSDNGDSGSPVFRWLGNDVLLAGILWGGTDDGSSFSFSPMDRVEQELGSLTTFDFPSPPPPVLQCPNGQKCCGAVGPDGICDGQCWPQNNPCP